MDLRLWDHGTWHFSESGKSKWKHGAISKEERLSHRHQEVLLHTEDRGKKKILGESNVSVWKLGEWRHVPSVSALLGCNQVGYCVNI